MLYSTVMRIIVVIGVKFQMLIAVTNWFQMKSITYLLKMRKIENRVLFVIYHVPYSCMLSLITGTDSFELMVLLICLSTLCHAASTASYVSYIDNSCLVQLVGRIYFLAHFQLGNFLLSFG